MRILLIESNETLGYQLSVGLKQYHHTVDWLKSARTIKNFFDRDSFDVLLLDFDLPNQAGLSLLVELRGKQYELPTILLTEDKAVDTCIMGLNNGADDCVLKSISLKELLARIHALQRRSIGINKSRDIIYTYRNLELNPNSSTVTLSNRNLNLSRREFMLLQKLLENLGRVVSREILTQCLYGWKEPGNSNTLEVHIHNLRKKLAVDLIKTVRGMGYLIESNKKKRWT